MAKTQPTQSNHRSFGSESMDRFVTSEPDRSHILVIDDEAMIGALATSMLKQDDVEVFQSPRQALARTRETLFDAVLCDFSMPEMTGIEVYEALASASPVLATHFVLMTALVETPALQGFLARTHVPILPKPFGALELERCVRHAIARL